MIVTIDGPAGAGKTSVARAVARELSLPILDTGAIYRCVALLAERRGIAWTDAEALGALARGMDLRFEPAQPDQLVILNDEDVTSLIRTPHISEGASQVSAHPPVRESLLERQRALGAQGCVAEGRDMGTVIFPAAAHKFFLTASTTARAGRRHAQLSGRMGPQTPPVAEIEADMKVRDERDSSRATAPLKAADDAVVIDSSELDFGEVVDRILGAVSGGADSNSRA